MTTKVSAPRSSKVTVVTAPSSPPSSFVQTRPECGITSLYRPKNAMGSGEAPNTKRYVPPTRTSISQESRVRPHDFGTHHRLNRSGLVQASNTMRAGPLKVRVTTSSRTSALSSCGSSWGWAHFLVLPPIGALLRFEFFDNLVQLVECVPELAILL